MPRTMVVYSTTNKVQADAEAANQRMYGYTIRVVYNKKRNVYSVLRVWQFGKES